MTTALFTHEACDGHVTPNGHPERVSRLHAVMDGLDASGFEALQRHDAPLAEVSAIALAHPNSHINAIRAAAEAAGEGLRPLDPDTSVTAGSWEASLRAAGAISGAVDLVMSGKADNAFCAVRPPGHHAEIAVPMGFCLFNSIAIGALHAKTAYGLERVAVVDFDVHHGNGTAAIFAERPDCFFASSHQMPLYPGTGASDETGMGNLVNAPLAPETGSEAFRAAWEETILPKLDAFRPEFILVSAGFDAHRADPLGNLNLEDEDYAWITARLLERARTFCDGRLVSALEGGYDLPALKSASRAHVGELLRA